MAGLYEFWRDPAKDPDDPTSWVRSMTVITTSASESLSQIHHRMPLFVAPSEWSDWLDPESRETVELAAALAAQPTDWLQADPVATTVNSVRNIGPELTEPLPPG
jgi:putative SOS response-associated peptidase YedK